MVYVEDFDVFVQQAVALFQRDPMKCRYTQKYRGENKVIVLKVTDDKICIKHKVKVSRNLKKVDQFNAHFMRLAATK